VVGSGRMTTQDGSLRDWGEKPDTGKEISTYSVDGDGRLLGRLGPATSHLVN
jgi:hypothetical protein